METATFGTFLRDERERRQVSLATLAESTKLSVSAHKLMEAGNLDDLPPDVFVRGFIRSYAKTLGIPSNHPLSLLDQTLAERRRAAEPQITVASHIEHRPAREVAATAEPPSEDEPQGQRRGIGLAVFVIIVLLIATITLSLFLRQQPPSGEGLSLESLPAAVPPAAPHRLG